MDIVRFAYGAPQASTGNGKAAIAGSGRDSGHR